MRETAGQAMSARAVLAAASGTGVGLLGGLSIVYGSHSRALGLLLGASAVSISVIAFVASLWLAAARPASGNDRPALVVFLLSIALGLMLGMRAHGGHGS